MMTTIIIDAGNGIPSGLVEGTPKELAEFATALYGRRDDVSSAPAPAPVLHDPAWEATIIEALGRRGGSMKHTTEDVQRWCVGRPLLPDENVLRYRMDKARRRAYAHHELATGMRFQYAGKVNKVVLYELRPREEGGVTVT